MKVADGGSEGDGKMLRQTSETGSKGGRRGDGGMSRSAGVEKGKFLSRSHGGEFSIFYIAPISRSTPTAPTHAGRSSSQS